MHTKTITFSSRTFGFRFTGKEIISVENGYQAKLKGVRVGWMIKKVNGVHVEDDTVHIRNLINQTKSKGHRTLIEFVTGDKELEHIWATQTLPKTTPMNQNKIHAAVALQKIKKDLKAAVAISDWIKAGKLQRMVKEKEKDIKLQIRKRKQKLFNRNEMYPEVVLETLKEDLKFAVEISDWVKAGKLQQMVQRKEKDIELQKRKWNQEDIQSYAPQKRIGNLGTQRTAPYIKLTHTSVKISNIDWSIKQHRLIGICKQYGNVINANIPITNRQSAGSGIVVFSSDQEAQNCIRKLNGRLFGRRKVQVRLAQMPFVASKNGAQTKVITFNPTNFGVSYSGNKITKVTNGTQAKKKKGYALGGELKK